MNFALLFLDALIVSLLWVAALAACVGRVQRNWVRVGLLALVVLGPLALVGAFAVATAVMKFNLKVEPNWFGFAVWLLLGYAVGAALILRRAGRREAGLGPAAAGWRRGPLVMAWLAAAAVGYMTLLNMDLALRARCAVLSVEINSVYLATLPAITTDSQNAAPLYEKAFAQLRDDQEEAKQVNNPPVGNGENFDPNEPATIAYLGRHAATITLLRQAGALSGCRFDQDLLAPDITAILSSQNETRAAANVLKLDAREEIAHGHAGPAIADAAAILEMSRHIGQRPLLVSGLVGIGIDALGVSTLQEALPAVKSRDELAALHLEELPSVGRMFQQALRGEERYGLLLYGNMPAMQTEMVKGTAMTVPDTRLMSSGVGLEGAFFRVFFLDPDAYVKLLQNVQDLSIQPYYRVRDQLMDVQSVKSGHGLFTAILIPSLTRTFDTLARVEAMDECARAAVATTRYRLDHGTMPSHLDELVPAYLDAVPTDPFDGHPLSLAVKGDRWIVYSIGPDLVDDGGVDMVHGKGDVIFTLQRAATEATTRP
jgi:hypothetical protein